MKVFALLLVLATGCLDASTLQLITVTGTVTDTSTGAPIKGAGVQVLFGICSVSCAFQGSPGTGPTDSAGKYSVQINGPTGDGCGGYAYFVHVNAGSGYTTGDANFPCGGLTAQLNFALHPVQQYAISGTVTHVTGGAGVQGATIVVGLYPFGTTCLDVTACAFTALDSAVTTTSGAYALSFYSVATPTECAGKDFLLTIRAGGGYNGGEAHSPCGTLTSTVNMKLPP